LNRFGEGIGRFDGLPAAWSALAVAVNALLPRIITRDRAGSGDVDNGALLER